MGYARTAPPRLSLLPGERRRERVLSLTEEAAYLEAARNIGEGVLEAYRRQSEAATSRLIFSNASARFDKGIERRAFAVFPYGMCNAPPLTCSHRSR